MEQVFQKIIQISKEKEKSKDSSSFRDLEFEVRHVDGKTNALDRRREINWLKQGEDDLCKILSNARCLTEGIDVPALDAALFMNPKTSYVDVVQAVGRVMRKGGKEKELGYIILPVLIPSEQSEDVKKLLDDDKRYQVVWKVVQALRSHDARLELEINSGNALSGTSSKIAAAAVDGNGEVAELGTEAALRLELKLDQEDLLNAIHAKLIDKVGDRQYWTDWAKDVASIAQRSIIRINGLLRNENTAQEFEKFLSDLHEVVSPALTEEDAVNMLAQHLITAPVFEALFKDYDFAGSNPVSIAMSKMVSILVENGLDAEIADLERFYTSVKNRASSMTEPKKRQDLIRELYEKFFQGAFSKDAKKLGIVYTPVELVDFILHSAEDVLQKEFGKSLSDKGVNVIDPFIGTGTFITRLLQSDLIKDTDLERKFNKELHANEIVLLAYYIAAINIEEAYHGRRLDKDYESFDGIVLRDTFSSGYEEDQKSLHPEYFPINHKRAQRQDENEIQVIVGNPPWSIGQRSATEKNPNLKYENTIARISETYAERSTSQLSKGVYDSYVQAIRWASDRIEDEGIVAFVTNGGWLDGLSANGMRACLAEEFTSIYCFNLRGLVGGSSEHQKEEGGNIFGVKVAPVVSIFCKNPDKEGTPCEIFYQEFDDCLSEKEKLVKLQKDISIDGVDNWQTIQPDINNDWINQRDPKYLEYLQIGNPETRSDGGGNAIFKIYSLGVATNRDAWAYSSSKEDLVLRSKKAVDFYNEQIKEGRTENPEQNLGLIKWHAAELDNLRRSREAVSDPSLIRTSMYRPFYPQHVHYDKTFNARHYQLDKIFPTLDSENLMIGVSGRGTREFSATASKMLTDLNILTGGGGATL